MISDTVAKVKINSGHLFDLKLDLNGLLSSTLFSIKLLFLPFITNTHGKISSIKTPLMPPVSSIFNYRLGVAYYDCNSYDRDYYQNTPKSLHLS